MLLKTISIENFRGIERLDLDLDRTTVLIGENNAGKTSVLECLNLCLGRGASRRVVPFTEYDYHLATKDSDATASPPITITLVFREDTENEWPEAILQGLDKAVQARSDLRSEVRLRFSSGYDVKTKQFVYEWNFLDLKDNPLSASTRRLLAELQQFVPVFALTAVRDANQQFQARSHFWGAFVKNLKMDDVTRSGLEEQIESINQLVLDSHPPFNDIKTCLAAAAGLVPLHAKDGVSVEPVAARVSDMLSRTQVKLAAMSGAKLPIGQHGAGTQSLTVMFLFQAFLQAKLAEEYDKNSEPLLALEEPECHLHPSAIRALWATLDALKGQKLIATHSGDLLSAVPLGSLRRLAKKDGKVKCFSVLPGTLTKDEEEAIGYTIRAHRGSLLFARCWLLVEGQTEFWYLPPAARCLKLDLEREGIFCIEFTQVKGKAVPLIKLANALGIEWHLVADGDAAGTEYVADATANLAGALASDRITQLSVPDIEHALWDHGYSAHYESYVGAAHPSRLVPTTDPDYRTQIIAAATKRRKPELALVVAAATQAAGRRGLPRQIQAALAKARQLARKPK